MVLNMRESGTLKLILEMVKDIKYGQMVHFMKDTGKMIRQMAGVALFMLMVMYMRVIGMMIRLMVLANIITLMGQCTKESGRKTNSMGMVERHGPMVLAMKVTTKKARKMDMESLPGLMAQPITALSLTIISMARECIHGLITVLSMETGSITRCTVGVCSHGQMDAHMKVNMLMIRKKAMEYFNGLINVDMMGNGLMGNNMGAAHILQARAILRVESGKMEKELKQRVQELLND